MIIGQFAASKVEGPSVDVRLSDSPHLVQPELADDQVDDVLVGAAAVIGCHEVVADDEGERESGRTP